MSGFFNMDNGIFTVLSKIVDIIVISLIWVVCCIPVFTIGPATTALYYTVVKVIRRERSYLVREFFHSFKSNFKIGTIAGVLITFVYFILIFDRSFAAGLDGTEGFVLLCVFNAMLFILTCITVYIFPVLSRFNMKLKQLFKIALFMAMKHLPTTILLLLITAFFALVTYITGIGVLITPALWTLTMSLLLERVFKKYMPEKSEDAEVSGKDEWYLE